MKIAVIGTGSIGKRHITNLLKLGIRDLVAVSEHSKREAFTIDGTPILVSHSFSETLAEKPDAIVIANPTNFHLGYLKEAVSAGCNTYLEKPASISATGLKEIENRALEKRVTVAVGTMYRFNERLVSLKKRVEQGELGEIICVESIIGEHIADYHPEEDYRLSYTARAELGGGVLLTQIHQIDWLNWIFGPFESVFATGGHTSDLEIDVEDNATYMLRTPDGLPIIGHLNYLQRPKRAGLTVTGTNGRLDWNLFENTLTVTNGSNHSAAEIERSHYDRNAMFVATMEDFLHSMQNNSAPKSTLSEAREALQIVDTIKSSMNSKRSERILR
jgi:predicted dehydrogenase